jgi:hypothetical protein
MIIECITSSSSSEASRCKKSSHIIYAQKCICIFFCGPAVDRIADLLSSYLYDADQTSLDVSNRQ